MKETLIIPASTITAFFIAIFVIIYFGVKLAEDADIETSAVSYTDKTITIYDIATPEELKRVHGYTDYTQENYPNTSVDILRRVQARQDKEAQKTYAEAKSWALKSPDSNYYEFAKLYAERGDKEKAEEYANKIADPQKRRNTFVLLDSIHKKKESPTAIDRESVTVFDIATPEDLTEFFSRRLLFNFWRNIENFETPLIIVGELHTVFDIVPPENLRDIFSNNFSVLYEDEIAFYRAYVFNNPDSNFTDLAIFYNIRGEKGKAYKYINKIQDSSTKKLIIRRVDPISCFN
ncbi:MAG: hypothetical protein LBH05_01610 [Deferribacteraceae bacterium]|jgi:tetratricopeptide (TPR) repeat protein|nr:hypothetical protein [Deferribacteraceae bacterium]